MKGKWIYIKALLGVGIFIFLVSFSAQRHACRDLTAIHVQVDHSEGNYFINDSLVRLILDRDDLKVSSTPLGNLNIARIENEVDQNSFVKKSQVYKNTKGDLFIEIKQETPVARINTSKEEFYLTDEATKIPLSGLYSANVILVVGEVLDEDLQGLKTLIQYISDDKLLKKHIIGIKKERPDSFNLVVNWGGYIIEFGALNQIEEKMTKLKLFYDQFLNKVPYGYYEKISLKFNNQIVATKREENEK